MSAAAALAARRLKLVFADGPVEATVGDQPPSAAPKPPLERPRRSAYSAARADQPKLL
jgi:exodeoxyribonuclease VII large subunit